MPSSHLILCCPLLLPTSIFPSIRVFSNESALRLRWSMYWILSFSISPSNEYSGLISFRMDWMDLLTVQGTLKSLLQHHSSKARVFWCSAFFIVQLSHPYMTTGKTIALTRTFVGKVMSLLFNMMSRLFITFLPRRKHLLISWLQYKDNSKYWNYNIVQCLSHVWLSVTPWTVTCQAPVPMEFSRQEYWSGEPFPSPGGLTNLRTDPGSAALQAYFLLSEPQRLLGLSVQFSRSVVSSSLQPHARQHSRLSCPLPTPRACSNSCPLSRWYHPTISSSVIPLSSCLQSFPASGYFLMSQLFASSGQGIGASASASVLPVNIQDWFPLGLTGWISLQSKGLSRVCSNTVQKHQFFSVQLSL